MQKSTPGVTPLKSLYIPVTRKKLCEGEEKGGYLVLLVKITVFSQTKKHNLVVKGARKTRIGAVPYFAPFAPYVNVAFDYFTPAVVYPR